MSSRKSKKNVHPWDRRPTLPTDQQIAFYLPLIEKFTDGHIDARRFKTLYLQLVKTGKELLDREVSDVVNRLFSDADTYESYEHLRDSETLKDAELLECAIIARDRLLEILQTY